jgi:hypothetical protein
MALEQNRHGRKGRLSDSVLSQRKKGVNELIGLLVSVI